MTESIFRSAIDDMIGLNRLFHSAIFALSDLKLFEREIRRLWDMSEGHPRALLDTAAVRQQIVVEHRRTVEPLSSRHAAALAT